MKNLKYSILVFLASLFVFTACEKDKEIKIFTVPVYKNLYLVGNASPAGWDIGNATPLVVNPDNAWEFSWEGTLLLGEFKIPTKLGDWGADFFMPVENGETDLTKSTLELVKGGNPDKKWTVTKPGIYKITVNIEDLDNPTIVFELIEALPDYPNLYLIGSASPAGWDIGNATQMTVDASSAFVHVWEGALVEGELKFMTAKDWGAHQFTANQADETDLSKTGCFLFKGNGDDQKWKITAETAGTYKITLNIKNLEAPTVVFEKQ